MLRVMLFVLAMGAGTPASAVQTAPVTAATQQAEPDAAALAAARELLGSTGYDEQVAAAARQSSEATFSTMLQQLESRFQTDFPAELEAQFRQIMREHVEQLIDDMRPTGLEESARIYARHFTAEELTELQRLQSHPVLVKMQRIAPQFMTELQQIGIAAAAQRLPALIERLQTAIADWQRAHPTGE